MPIDEHLVAGLSGGFVTTLVVHPLDLLKVRYQVNEGNHAVRPQYSSYFDLARHVVRERGIVGLYQGGVPNILGSTLGWGLYFMFFNALKDRLPKDSLGSAAAHQHLLAGLAAGVLSLTLTNPIWVIKTRLCLQYEDRERRYRGSTHALRLIFKEEGIRGLYKGYVPGLFGTSHGALQFMAYEELKKLYCQHFNQPITTKLDTMTYLSFAALSKVFAATTTYPYQVIRSRLQDQHANYNGVFDVIKRTFRKEGIYGFYKGLVANLLRVTPATGITFVVYENVRHFLQERRRPKLS